MPRIRVPIAILALLLALGVFVAPAARAQTIGVYFPATGHHLFDDRGFLSFWQAHDGQRLLGSPITEEYEVNGKIVQYFERGRVELTIDQASGTARFDTGRVGEEYAEALWRRFAPAPPRRPAVGVLYVEATGHTLREPFLGFWQSNGGAGFFGQPISEPLWELTEQGQRQVQYFERARLERDPAAAGTPDEIVVGRLGYALARLMQVDITPVESLGFEQAGPLPPPPVDEGPIVTPTPEPPPPTPAPPPALAPSRPRAQQAVAPARPVATRPARRQASAPTSSGKAIVVNLSRQWMYAFQDGQQVFDAPVTTGRDGMETPAGRYSIYAKIKNQTMSGVTDGEPWVVPNVPNVMYINGGVALHGTYWHRLFGSGVRVSHGCINLPLDAAAWVYNWAPQGTLVTVTY